MNKMIAGFLLGISVSAPSGASAARDSTDMLVQQHQIEPLRAEQARQVQAQAQAQATLLLCARLAAHGPWL